MTLRDRMIETIEDQIALAVAIDAEEVDNEVLADAILALPELRALAAGVWVVTNAHTYDEAAVIAVFSDELSARAFADKRNEQGSLEHPSFFVHHQTIDEWLTA